jgi:predicted nucleotidyltransferase
MKLTSEEELWLSSYREILAKQFPDLVEQIIVFGSKAKGTATEDSDLDLLVVIRDGDWKVKDAITRPGYLLALETNAVPSMIVLTGEEWESLRRREAPFWQTVRRDGVVLQ